MTQGHISTLDLSTDRIVVCPSLEQMTQAVIVQVIKNYDGLTGIAVPPLVLVLDVGPGVLGEGTA